MPDKVYITKQDIQRLMRVLELQRLAVVAMEVHSFDDLHSEIQRSKGPKGEQEDKPWRGMYHMDMFVNPGLEEGAFRVLPAPRFRICGRIAEWNVQKDGHVAAVLDVDVDMSKGFASPRMILAPEIIAKK